LRLLLLGATGQVGRELRTALAPLGHVVCASRDGKLGGDATGETADLSESQTLVALLDRVDPDIIVNAAAYTAVDRAEDEEALASRINAEALAVLGAWAARKHVLVVHYSTDYVFDGRGTRPYAEEDNTSPLGAYGRSKLGGEIALRASGAPHFIFRTAWVYAPHGQNFLLTMLRLGVEKDELRVVADQIGAPTSAASIANGTATAIEHWRRTDGTGRSSIEGTYHLVASGQTSWHGFASAIFAKARAAGIIDKSPVVSAISSAEFPTRATRPGYSVLDNALFQRTFGVELLDWTSSLDDVLTQLPPRH
jgi:dTDP-4-dehydrorhamnose reductase